MPVADIIRQLGISEQTFYRWKKLYSGLQPDQARELKQLQDENARLKRLVAELSLDKAILQDVAAKTGAPALKRLAVDYIVSRHRTSQRRACRLVKLHRSNEHYRSVKNPCHDLRLRMRELAMGLARAEC